MPERLSLIAGSGALVPEVIAVARRRGFALQVVSVTERRIPAGVPTVRLNLGDPLPALAEVRRFGASLVAMAGGLAISDRGRETLLGVAGLEARTIGDTALSALSEFVERQTGARLIGVHEIAPELLAADGLIAGPKPSAELLAAVSHAVAIVRRAGELDLGQAAVVSGRRVVALEDVAGTDALLARVRAYHRRGLAGDGTSPLVLAKAAKPSQPLAIDMPAIGPRTIANARKAGIGLIAVQSGATLVIARTRLMAAAAEAGLPVVGVSIADA